MSGRDKSSRLIIIIGSDLNMSLGLMAAQVSHVIELVGYNAARAMSDLSLWAPV
jgi:peptidyl-tRNA hydrolase